MGGNDPSGLFKSKNNDKIKMTELKNKTIIGRIKAATISFSAISLTWFLLLFIISFFEIIYNGIIHEFPQKLVNVTSWAVLGDVTFLLGYLAMVYIIYLLLFLFSEGFNLFILNYMIYYLLYFYL